jgi:hypothetical protein
MAARPVATMVRHITSAGVIQLVLGTAYRIERYPGPVSTATLCLAGAAVTWVLVAASRRTRGALVAFLGAGLVCYVAIAAGRALLVGAMAAPGHLAQQYAGVARYHYHAQAMFAVALSLVVAEIARRMHRWPRATRAILVAWGIVAVAAAAVVGRSVDHHDGFRTAYTTARDGLEADIRRQPPGSTVCIPNRPAIPWPGAPGTVAVFVLEHATDDVDGRRVLFTSTDLDEDLEHGRDVGGRLERLLRTPADCPPHDLAPAAGG